MKSQTKKILKLSGIILGALTAVTGILIAVVLNFIFTSEKLTPIVLEAANRNLNAKLDMKSVELTFFSTFPRFGVQLTDGTLVSKAIRDTLWQRTDTLVSFKKAVAVVNPMDYLRQQKISIHRLALEHADIYAYKNKDGIANWDITVPDTVQSASSPTGDAMNISELDIRQISIQHATVTMDDRDTRIFANLWDTDLTLKANMKKGHSMLAVDFRNKNLLFWQDGQLLANRIATHLRTDLELNTARHSLLLHDAMIDINGTKLGVKGTVRRDTAAKAIDVDLQYGLHTPSLETVLHMIPESILKKAEVSAGGEVSFIGTLKGMYGKQKMPLATLDIRIKDAFARYAGLPYGIDKVNADFSARIDLMRNTPSCLNLKIFQFKGADTDILADMKVDNLLTDPDITFHTRSTVDLNTLAQIFPLQEGIGMDGKMDTDLKLRCRLSTLKKQDWGRVKMQGKIRTDKLVLRHTQKNFEFTSNATLDFAGNEWLGGRVEIKDMTLRSPALNSATESFTAAISTYPSQDTLRPAKTECKIEMNKLRVSLADSLDLFCGKSSARLKLQPGEHNPANPQIGLTLEADTLFCRMGDTDILGKETDVTELRSRIGMVFQRPTPFPMSIFDNIAYGVRLRENLSKSELEERVVWALQKAALWDDVKDKLDQPGTSLSGGQQQRLCIARTLALNPDVILFDEPCSALDPISTLAIEDLMSSIVADRAIVIVTHNMEQASRVSNRTAFFYMGDMVEYDETDEIFQRPKDKRLNDYLTGMFS